MYTDPDLSIVKTRPTTYCRSICPAVHVFASPKMKVSNEITEQNLLLMQNVPAIPVQHTMGIGHTIRQDIPSAEGRAESVLLHFSGSL